MLGSPPDNLAAVSLVRAAIADDPDSGVLILSQHGGCLPGAEGMKAAAFMMALAGVSARALLSAHGYNVERTLAILDTWAAEYADDSAVA
jgi:hypothetical protein